MANVLVTGGAGFIGSHVADALLARGHQVVVLDDLSGGYDDNVPRGAEFVRGSVTDHRLIDSLFAERRFDYVFHLAAYAAEGLSHFIKRFNYTNNVIGSVNLINAAVNTDAKGFVFTSSIAVYGASPYIGPIVNLVPGAEEADHHPDITINYKRVTLVYSTHSEGGLTTKDFDGARMADHVFGAMQ